MKKDELDLYLAAQTIGLDLVKVEPMKNPEKIDLRWFDFKYGLSKKEEPKGRQIFSDIDPYGEEIWEE